MYKLLLYFYYNHYITILYIIIFITINFIISLYLCCYLLYVCIFNIVFKLLKYNQSFNKLQFSVITQFVRKKENKGKIFKIDHFNLFKEIFPSFPKVAAINER